MFSLIFTPSFAGAARRADHPSFGLGKRKAPPERGLVVGAGAFLLYRKTLYEVCRAFAKISVKKGQVHFNKGQEAAFGLCHPQHICGRPGLGGFVDIEEAGFHRLLDSGKRLVQGVA